MLGCQDFCGYYDWTFHFVRQRFGSEAVQHLWAHAIGGESQEHYLKAGLQQGLRGLYNSWTKTGEDEHCDWTFTLDEQKNVLRWDMRQCPSKGFLLNNDLNADEDYCDHCMGWIIPMLDKVGAEMVVHEHNHCGQCWGEMRMKDKPYQPLDLPIDIRKDARWKRGYTDRWSHDTKLPLMSTSSAVDPCDVLRDWFAGIDDLLVVGSGAEQAVRENGAALVGDSTYATRDKFPGEPRGVLIAPRSTHLSQLAQRFLATPSEKRPLLMHAYLPGEPPLDFGSHDLPRPVPILPQLIRAAVYVHRPGETPPGNDSFMVMLAAALGKKISVVGVDLNEHPCGATLRV